MMGIHASFAQTDRPADEAKGLQVNARAPDFSAKDTNDSTFVLSEALKDGPIVMIFYRGQWCPYCNRHLSNLQDSLEMITGKGARVIAISPEPQEKAGVMKEKTGATFTLLHDEDYHIEEAYDVTFRSKLRGYLPVPATYIINKEGVIVWRHFDPDYHERSTVSDILKHLP